MATRFVTKTMFLCNGFQLGSSRGLEISPLTSKTALEQRSVPWGSHLSVFSFEQSHGDVFRDQSVPHVELKLFLRSAFFLLFIVFLAFRFFLRVRLFVISYNFVLFV